MTNTEKPTTKAEQKKNIVDTSKQSKPKVIDKQPQKKEMKKDVNSENTKSGEIKTEDKKNEVIKEEKVEDKKQVVKKIKRDFAVVNGKSVPVSTKYATSICKFIKHKKIQTAIDDLEQVSKLRKAVPMKGEIPHRKGRIMSGRFPVNASKEFIVLLKSLQGNSNANDMEDPIITEAIANMASRPYGRGGRIKKKRTHLKIVARERKELKKRKKK